MEKDQFDKLTRLLEEMKKLLDQHDTRLSNIEKTLTDLKPPKKGKGQSFFDSMQV